MHEIWAIYRPKLAETRARIGPWDIRGGGLGLDGVGSKVPLPLVGLVGVGI